MPESMDILAVYEMQRGRALADFPDLVSEARLLRLASGTPLKLRLELIDGIGDVGLIRSSTRREHTRAEQRGPCRNPRIVSGTCGRARPNDATHMGAMHIHVGPPMGVITIVDKGAHARHVGQVGVWPDARIDDPDPDAITLTRVIPLHVHGAVPPLQWTILRQRRTRDGHTIDRSTNEHAPETPCRIDD